MPQEDLFNPCVLKYDLTKEPSASLVASLQSSRISGVEYLKEKEELRRKDILDEVNSREGLFSRLTQAADQYIVTRGKKKTVIAGYHWFGDWGRDTMISLPGLTLSTGRYKDAEDILLNFSKYVDQGMLPNCFPESNRVLEYNTIDAALWYFEAIPGGRARGVRLANGERIDADAVILNADVAAVAGELFGLEDARRATAAIPRRRDRFQR